MKSHRLLWVVVLWGCGGQLSPNEVALDQPVVVTTSGTPDSTSAVRFEIDSPISDRATTVGVALAGLSLRIERRGDHADVSVMQMPLMPTTISSDILPPGGITLGDMRLGADASLELEIADLSADHMTLVGELPLVLHWSLVLDQGGMWPLGDRTTELLAVQLDVSRDEAGQERVSVSARCAGVCLEVPELFSISNVVLVAATNASIEAL